MNSFVRNKRNIQKMEEIDQIYKESDEDLDREAYEKKRTYEANREYPLATARRFAWVICGAFWLFGLGSLFMEFEMDIFFPFLAFSLAVLAGLHVPMFLIQKKMFDVVIATIFALACITLGLSILIRG